MYENKKMTHIELIQAIKMEWLYLLPILWGLWKGFK